MDRDESAVHISRLRLMAKSAWHYNSGYGEETYAMERGDGFHGLVFGTKRVVSWPEKKQRRGEEYDKFVADNPDAVVLTHNEGKKVLAMAEAVQRCPEAMRVLEGDREQTIRWTFGDRQCEGTPDVANRARRFITELKSLPDGNPWRAQWHGRKLGYHAQLAWYRDGFMQLGDLFDEAYVVAVEGTYPVPPPTIIRLTQRTMDEGQRMYRSWWERLMVCEASGEFPGYVQSIVDWDVPDDDQELDFGGAEEAA